MPVIFKIIAIIIFAVTICCVSLLCPITVLSIFHLVFMCILSITPSLFIVDYFIFVNAFIVILKYAYQIRALSNFLISVYPSFLADYLPLKDIGLTICEGNLFFELFADILHDDCFAAHPMSLSRKLLKKMLARPDVYKYIIRMGCFLQL